MDSASLSPLLPLRLPLPGRQYWGSTDHARVQSRVIGRIVFRVERRENGVPREADFEGSQGGGGGDREGTT